MPSLDSPNSAIKNRLNTLGKPAASVRIAISSLMLFLAASLFSPFLRAEHTRTWRQSSYDEFLKGTSNGVAVRSDGRLELSPKFTLLADADASFLWSVRVDSKGVLYAGGGSPAKVFRFDAGGKPTTAFESTDLAVQAIAFDAKGSLYVATSPDGKVYRVSATGEKSVFFDPKTKYIWDLTFGADGTLYVATGDKGQIFAVAPDGKSELFYNSDEAHIRVMAFDAKGNLLAGTEPSGRVLRVTPLIDRNLRKSKDAGMAEGFVLYETSKREVTSLAVAPDGSIYAAAIGEKQHNGGPATAIITTAQGTTTITGGGAVGGAQANQTPFVAFPPLLSSSIYKISPEGAPEELWSSRDDLIYSLAINSDGRLLAGTGNSGALLEIDGRGVFAQLAKSGSAQITGISRGANGRIFLCTANPGKVFAVGPEYQPEGTYESRSFDAGLFSQWGRLDWWSPPPAKSAKSAAASSEPRLEFFVRSGNTEDPGKEWSRWFGPYSKPGANTEIPSARFAQWKAVIHDGRPGDGIEWVSLAYLPRNVAPVIDGIAVQDPGVRVQGVNILQSGQQPTVNLKSPPASNANGVVISQSGNSPRFEQPPQGFAQKGFMSVLWNAHDDNDDDLRFAVYYRGENENEWKLLKDKLDQKFYSWDATALPDGAYYLKVVASDGPANPPGVALNTERESERFAVDNTPPVIEHLEASVTVTPGKANGDPQRERIALQSSLLKFTARDATSGIERAQYSVDGGDWTLVNPVGTISDSLEERYEFQLGESLAPGEHTIAVRAFDHFDNVGSAKTTVRVPEKIASRPLN
jgi:outer membrane protein assembly factor BamB